MKLIIYTAWCTLLVAGCCAPQKNKSMNSSAKNTICEDACAKKEMSCKLTSPELRERKATVLASLKNKMTAKKELSNGFSYRFKGTDTIIDELATFIKTERQCCDFFDFAIAVKGDTSEAWLTITGQEGIKEFIVSELGF